jgi:SulP family sulfate permease
MVPRTWKGDLVAGVTVGIVALPLALAFGVSSGAGAEAGLITAIVAGVVAAVFGGSSVQVSGPTGAMVVVLAPIVATHGVAAVAAVSVLAGIITLAAGAARLGRLVSIIPWPVIEGFTLGIAVIIFLQQVPAAVGVPAEHGVNAIVGAIAAVGAASWPGALWAIGTVAVVALVMVLLPRIHARIPASLVAIVLVTVLAVLLVAPLPSIGPLPSALPAPAIPPLGLDTLRELIVPAFAVAALAAIESLLSARVGASLADTGRIDPDRELVGQGLASVAAGLFGGMPATGAIARTAVNVRSGGRSRLAAITHGVVLLGIVTLAAPLVGGIPLAALAGVLMVTAVRMVSPSVVRSVVTTSRSDALVFALTAVITVAFDLIVAVGIGIAVAAVFALRALARSGRVVREDLPGAPQPGDDRIALLRFDGALFFAAAERMVEAAEELPGVSVVILRLSQVTELDATGARVLSEVITRLERRGTTVLVKGIPASHTELATRAGVYAAVRHPAHVFADLEAAIEHARSHVRREADARSEASGEPVSESPEGEPATP